MWNGILVSVIWFSDCQNHIYVLNRFIHVITPLESSDLYPNTAGIPQGAIWFPTLFNLYIRLLPIVVKHSLIVGYTDNYTLLKIIPVKSDHVTAASPLKFNYDFEAISQFDKIWQIRFDPNKIFFHY